MIWVDILFLAAFAACAAWLVVRGMTIGWTTSTVVLLAIAICGIVGRIVSMRRSARQKNEPPRPSVDDLLRVDRK